MTGTDGAHASVASRNRDATFLTSGHRYRSPLVAAPSVCAERPGDDRRPLVARVPGALRLVHALVGLRQQLRGRATLAPRRRSDADRRAGERALGREAVGPRPGSAPWKRSPPP